MCLGAIAAGHELTARAGAAALAAGGSAVDAVVAAGAMSWAAESALTGPCGGGFVLVRPPAGRPALLDAFTAIPGRDLPPQRTLVEVDEVLVPFDERTSQVFHVGPAACAVPGVVAGLHEAHRRHGRLPWRDLLLPAAEAAQAGVETNEGQLRVFEAIRAILTRTDEARAVFQPAGRYVQRGTSIRQPDMAASIEQLAERGPEALYRGRLARAMVDHQHATGGRLTMTDLAAYRPVWRRPLRRPYAGHELVTNPPPSSGGVLIAYILGAAEGIAVDGGPGAPRALRALAEAMRAAGRRRDATFARLLHRGGLPGHLLSEVEQAAGRREVLAALDAGPSDAPARRSDRGTTHVSVLDGDGMAAAFTASNGSHSGVIVPGTGLHLNNMMGEEDLAAGRHRGPGGRLTSMQAPSVLEREGAARLVVGSSGSNRLRSAIAQVIRLHVEHGLPVGEAVAHPRVHVEQGRLDVEGGFAPATLEALEAAGERLVTFAGLNLYFGGANAVARDGSGRLSAAGDPRRSCFGLVL